MPPPLIGPPTAGYSTYPSKYPRDGAVQPAVFTQPLIPRPLLGNPVSARATLNAAGTAVASAGPQRVREHWQLISASVATNPAITNAVCNIYVGTIISEVNFFATTNRGSTGDTCGFGGMDIQPGMQVFAQWTGGDAGATATLIINATYTLGSP